MDTSEAKAISHNQSTISAMGISNKRKLVLDQGSSDKHSASLTDDKKPKSEGKLCRPNISLDRSPKEESKSKVPISSGSTDKRSVLSSGTTTEDHGRSGETPTESTKAALGNIQSSSHHIGLGETMFSRSPEFLHREQAKSVPSCVLPQNSVCRDSTDVAGPSMIPKPCTALQEPAPQFNPALEADNLHAMAGVDSVNVECAQSELTEIPIDVGMIPSRIHATPAVDVGHLTGGGSQARRIVTASVDNGGALNTVLEQERLDNEKRKTEQWGKETDDSEDSSDED